MFLIKKEVGKEGGLWERKYIWKPLAKKATDKMWKLLGQKKNLGVQKFVNGAV